MYAGFINSHMQSKMLDATIYAILKVKFRLPEFRVNSFHLSEHSSRSADFFFNSNGFPAFKGLYFNSSLVNMFNYRLHLNIYVLNNFCWRKILKSRLVSFGLDFFQFLTWTTISYFFEISTLTFNLLIAKCSLQKTESSKNLLSFHENFYYYCVLKGNFKLLWFVLWF